MKNIYYSVDRVENNYIVLESLNTGEIKNIKLDEVNLIVNKNDILMFDGKKYVLDNDKKNIIISIIKSKMDKLKK